MRTMLLRLYESYGSLIIYIMLRTSACRHAVFQPLRTQISDRKEQNNSETKILDNTVETFQSFNANMFARTILL